MKNQGEMRPTWVLWWLLAILISVVCIAFTGVKRAYAQDVRTIKDSKGTTDPVRFGMPPGGSKESSEPTTPVGTGCTARMGPWSTRRTPTRPVGNNFKHFDYICVWQMKLLSPRCDWT